MRHLRRQQKLKHNASNVDKEYDDDGDIRSDGDGGSGSADSGDIGSENTKGNRISDKGGKSRQKRWGSRNASRSVFW